MIEPKFCLLTCRRLQCVYLSTAVTPETAWKLAKWWNLEALLVWDLEQTICVSIAFVLNQGCLLIINPTGCCRISNVMSLLGAVTSAPHCHHTNGCKEATRFVRHTQWTLVATNDIDQAFHIPNIKPTTPHTTFPHSGVQYHTLPTQWWGHCTLWRMRLRLYFTREDNFT